MIVLVSLLVFETVEALELRVASSQSVCSFAQIVFQMMVTALDHALVLSFKITGLVLIPDKTGIFCKACLTGETVNITDLSNDPGSINVADHLCQ